ncbi:MAG: isocitrate/isopropylmalate dehydrogenase family protein [Anaerolineae bacterium]
MTTICLIPGDGVGQEVIPAAARVLAAVLPAARLVQAEAGWDCFSRTGTALPAATLAAVAAADATLFGATQSPSTVVAGYQSPILALRKHFDLYANLRPTAALPGARSFDLLLVRENSEGLYSGRERLEGADMAIAERVITRRASERIAHVAFTQARAGARRGQPAHVTVVHKANVLKLSDGLFRTACLDVAAQYPDVSTEEMLVDAAAMWLVKEPARFAVLVTTNLFGDILSDLAAGLAGGLGIAPSANLGADGVAVFEPVHGSAPDIAGRGIANPIGAILSVALLLEHVQQATAADRVRGAVQSVLAAGCLPPDLGGSATTDQVTTAILQRLEEIA